MVEGKLEGAWVGRTESTIHGRGPRFWAWASLAIFSYSLLMPAGALVGPGREKGALMSSLSAGESLDMLVMGGGVVALSIQGYGVQGRVASPRAGDWVQRRKQAELTKIRKSQTRNRIP